MKSNYQVIGFICNSFKLNWIWFRGCIDCEGWGISNYVLSYKLKIRTL